MTKTVVNKGTMMIEMLYTSITKHAME